MPPEVLEIAGMSELENNPALSTSEDAIYKMRCSRCQRLYSVSARVVEAAFSSDGLARPLRFQCQSENCGTRFEVAAFTESDLHGEILPTRDAMQLPSRTVVEKAPLEETPCPKCQRKTALSATECRHCGVVFSKVAKAEKSERFEDFGGRRDLADLWSSIMDDYESLERHERFIEECYRAGLLSVASQRYSRILSATPAEEIARNMRRRIVGLASFKAETARGADGGTSIRPGFRIPKMNDLILTLGGATMTIGFLLPSCRDLVGVGSAAIALGVGVRFFLGPKSF